MACHHLAVASCLFAFYIILVLVNLLPFILGWVCDSKISELAHPHDSYFVVFWCRSYSSIPLCSHLLQEFAHFLIKLRCMCSHFQLPWASVEAHTPITEGTKFCVCAHEVATWIMNPLQVLYVDSKEPPTCMVSKALSTIDPNQAAFAFGSGTLQGHLLVPYSGLEVVNLSLVHYIERNDAMLWEVVLRRYCLQKKHIARPLAWMTLWSWSYQSESGPSYWKK